MRKAAAVAVIAIVLCVCAKKTAPNTAPAAQPKGGTGVKELNAHQKTSGTAQTNQSKPEIAPCNQASPCYVIEQPQAKTEEQQAKEASLDRLYRCYLWATILGVIGAFGGLGILIGQTVLTRRAANAAKDSADAARLNTEALVNSERPYIDGEFIRKDAVGVIRYDLIVKNHGKTPAHLLTVVIEGGITLNAMRGEFVNVAQMLESGEPRTVKEGLNLDDFVLGGNAAAESGVLKVRVFYAPVVWNGKAGDKPPYQTEFVCEYKPLTGTTQRVGVFNSYT